MLSLLLLSFAVSLVAPCVVIVFVDVVVVVVPEPNHLFWSLPYLDHHTHKVVFIVVVSVVHIIDVTFVVGVTFVDVTFVVDVTLVVVVFLLLKFVPRLVAKPGSMFRMEWNSED